MQATANSLPTVLITDDDASLSNMWREILSSAGFPVLTSNNGLKALDTVRYGNKVDVVLLDYKMAPLDGAQTLEHLKARFPNVKTIGVTGVQSSQVPAAFRDGVQKLLVKPVNSSELIDAIHAVTGVPAPAATEPKRRTQAMRWSKFAFWYALFLIACAGIFVLLHQAMSEVMTFR